MPLPLRERLTMLMPPSVFYRQRIAQEARTGEPELAVLAELVPRGGIAVDIGANVGFFAYALADIADRVVAFEPNPDYAFFARWMLRGRAEVREIALSDASGRGTLYVPLSDQGMLLHLAGSLKRSHVQFRHIKTYDVEIRTLDEAGLAGVRFVKADVEGGEREVLDGARATIARDRPIIMLELLSGTHENPAADVAAICESFGYEAFIVQHGERIAALPAIFALGKNTSWGSAIESRNVLSYHNESRPQVRVDFTAHAQQAIARADEVACDIARSPMDFRFQEKSGHAADIARGPDLTQTGPWFCISQSRRYLFLRRIGIGFAKNSSFEDDHGLTDPHHCRLLRRPPDIGADYHCQA